MGLASGEHPPAPSPRTGHGPRELFLGGGMQKRCSITATAWLAGRASLQPALGRRPARRAALAAAPGTGHRPRLPINHPQCVCPWALTSAGPRLMDYPFNPTSP